MIKLPKRNEKELIDRLMKTGLKKNTAKTLLYLAEKDEAKSREIESHTTLRQPEISVAVRELRDRKWISKREINKEGRGRPQHSYKLKKPLRQIMNEIQENEMDKVRDIEENLESMKKIVEG
ncbi:MAG: helix-turn-helix domain-containing protein [Thermoplasmatota archaeon]